MAVYVDDAAIVWKGKPRFHLSADSVDELHGFAQAVGINRCWYHSGARHPHYDITEPQRATAIENGAIAVSQRELMQVARRISRKSFSGNQR
ncbi:DUF4031 domain-containing protein [Paraburkholderia fungorum]|uniref:DUF4031 domain-containing protein n=1 Tax=Paraburkholderia fungorum TaxID=134537 RepID=A0AAW3V0J8_9BURK|nr:DUF4031 domain-containing protein [Paraburkholderia fungorum]MBB4517391.1 hypothetical protein [Paraburkholderia fungorum]MBB6204459.1 hypothetical protein [Paraburkholderia fungorum]